VIFLFTDVLIFLNIRILYLVFHLLVGLVVVAVAVAVAVVVVIIKIHFIYTAHFKHMPGQQWLRR